MGIQEANLRRTRAAKNRRFVQVWKGKGTSPRSYPIDYGPDDETPDGNRDAIDLANNLRPLVNDISYDDLAPELQARLERMRKLLEGA